MHGRIRPIPKLWQQPAITHRPSSRTRSHRNNEIMHGDTADQPVSCIISGQNDDSALQSSVMQGAVFDRREPCRHFSGCSSALERSNE